MNKQVRMFEEELRVFSDTANWLATHQSLVVTVVVMMIGWIVMIPMLLAIRAKMFELAEHYKSLVPTKRSPPKRKLRTDEKEFKADRNYPDYLKNDPQKKKRDRALQGFLKTEQGQEWKKMYEATSRRGPA